MTIIIDIHEKKKCNETFLIWVVMFHQMESKKCRESVELGNYTRLLEILFWIWSYKKKLKLCFIKCITSFF